MKTFLFQGDSITDVGRDRDREGFGEGYPLLTAADLGYRFPNQFNFINRGVSGNRIVDIYARIKKDIINLKPDYMSLLIGVNDVWHEVSREDGVSAAKFEMVYSLIIEEIKAALPDIKIFILEPYVVKGTATIEEWETFDSEVKKRAAAAKRIAEKYSLPFLTLQDKFDKASEVADPSYWVADGVHPTKFGHELISKSLAELFVKEEKLG